MPSPELRSTDEMLGVVTRQAAHRLGRRARRRRILKLAAVVVVVAGIGGVAVAARLGTETQKFQTVGAQIDDVDRYQLTSGAGGSATSADSGLQVPDADREVVSTGTVTVQVDDVEAAAEDAAAIATDAGGYVESSETELDGDQTVRLTLRVPADDFEATMTDAADLGEVQSSKTDARDVTDQVADLEGRLKTARATTDRLRELLVDAENVQNIITINDRLAALETEIETLTGELQAVQDRVAFATVTVHLTEHEAATVSDDLPGPLEAMRSGAVAFVNVVLAAGAALAFSLPFLAVGLAAWWIVRRWRNRGLRR